MNQKSRASTSATGQLYISAHKGSLGHEKPRASVDGPSGETGGLVDGVVGDVDPLPRLRTFMVDRWGRRPSGRGTVSPTTEITATSQRHGQCGAG